jgi:pyruvate formate lyase activating enzyme
VDLKAFTEDFYHRVTFAKLQPVLETLEYLKHETGVWFELTTLLIPGQNDSDAELTKLSEWVLERLGPDVPLHFSAFHPDFKMMDVPPTPPATLRRARELARRVGLHHVYTGNVHDTDGDTTFCGGCGGALIVRDWYQLLDYRVTAQGGCPDCGARLPGCFDAAPGAFGRRRVPVRMRASGA